jgi:hypothetical protein
VDFELRSAVAVLSRTPGVLDVLLRELPEAWTTGREGPETWSPYDVVGHLIHGERTDWMPRVTHVLAHGDRIPFPTFDRFAHIDASRGKTLPDLLDTFRSLRVASLEQLAALRLGAAELARTGLHPDFGRVTLSQHLATWVAHDLDHLAQIARVMGRQYTEAVGPWRQYLRIMRHI